jgi:hypothetical protein
LYQLAPNIHKIYWKGYTFSSVYDYAEQLTKEALKSDLADQTLLMTAEDESLLLNLKYHAIAKGENPDLNVKIIDNLIKYIKREPLDTLRNAIRVGNALTGKHHFIIGNKCFETTQEFCDYLDDLYNNNFPMYVRFCQDNSDEINQIKVLFIGEQKEIFEKNFLKICI